ncbi:S8 family serine peptidase [Pontibacter qinzhouensis]|uniref:S8 family serine peptidase n=1 Tax=Pontibacter qinzhouensis TaxID=2603253 RepID=A0A5C8KCH9_9BACT|nr:S8 family peptidase [Pontibacter qinzhouensis]TXK49269.1 S8 family serine peptidase [Pontibacter qinzhouensis]
MNNKLNQVLLLALGFSMGNGYLQHAAAQGEVTTVTAFDSKYVDWYNRSATQDKIQGVGVDRAYKELLPTKQPKKKIVVAVIDSGLDINHEDLQGKVWVNKKEIPGNGIDDDNNGYVDDVHGWSFLGNAAGENIRYETYEYIRIYRKLAPVYQHIAAVEAVPADKQEEYKTFLRCQEKYEKEVSQNQKTQENLTRFEEVLATCEAVIGQHLGKSEFTVAEIRAIATKNDNVQRARGWLLSRYDMGFEKASFQKYKDHTQNALEKHLNPAYNPRAILADDHEDINDRNYGNNDVKGPRPDHGTPVAGLIAGVRNNNLGINGIAEHVEIMALRAVPEGDEYDKDIALAIRYAVDNGANIINMSFGKEFSPEKQYIDEAIKYAEANNVLLVHAAGNSAYNIDDIIHYPTRNCNDGTAISSWIEVGASSMNSDKSITAEFTNYGKRSVDLFAPGVDIVSLAPENKYAKVDGTSFSSPVVSGVAALVWSYYPELTAVELKEVLVNSCTNYGKKKVNLPNEDSPKKKKTRFSNLSRTGGIINAYEALKLAEKVVNEKSQGV